MCVWAEDVANSSARNMSTWSKDARIATVESSGLAHACLLLIYLAAFADSQQLCVWHLLPNAYRKRQ